VSGSARPLRRIREPSIRWTPAHESYHVVAAFLKQMQAIPPRDLSQDALLRLEAHLTRDPGSLPFGLLAGALCECPRTKLSYLLLDDVTPSRSPLTEVDPMSELSNELRWLASDASSRGKLVLGWYIGGLGDDLEPDPETSAVHRELFPEPWQVMLSHDARAGVEHAALRRTDPVSGRLFTIPFCESYAYEWPRGPEGEPLTVVRWATYRASIPVMLHSDATLAKRATTIARVAGRSPLRQRLSLPPLETYRAPSAAVRPALAPAALTPQLTPGTAAPPPVTTLSVVAPRPVQYVYLDGGLVPFDEAPVIGAKEVEPARPPADPRVPGLLAAAFLVVALDLWLLMR